MLTKTSRGPGNLDALYIGPNMAEVALELAPSENRTISTAEVVRRWRDIMPELPGVKELSFKSDFFVGLYYSIQPVSPSKREKTRKKMLSRG